MVDVSVDDWVPEQSLVTVTPEERLPSDVHVLVVSWPVGIWDVGQVGPVLSVLLLNEVGVDGSQQDGWGSNEVRNLEPELVCALTVGGLGLQGLLERLSSSLVRGAKGWLQSVWWQGGILSYAGSDNIAVHDGCIIGVDRGSEGSN